MSPDPARPLAAVAHCAATGPLTPRLDAPRNPASCPVPQVTCTGDFTAKLAAGADIRQSLRLFRR